MTDQAALCRFIDRAADDVAAASRSERPRGSYEAALKHSCRAATYSWRRHVRASPRCDAARIHTPSSDGLSRRWPRWAYRGPARQRSAVSHEPAAPPQSSASSPAPINTITLGPISTWITLCLQFDGRPAAAHDAASSQGTVHRPDRPSLAPKGQSGSVDLAEISVTKELCAATSINAAQRDTYARCAPTGVSSQDFWPPLRGWPSFSVDGNSHRLRAPDPDLGYRRQLPGFRGDLPATPWVWPSRWPVLRSTVSESRTPRREVPRGL
jgi:hypothetical protein